MSVRPNERLVALGADGAHGGWLTAACYEATGGGRRTSVELWPEFCDLLGSRGDTDAPMAVDVPMGLLDTVGPRPCDAEAKERLGARRSSVFTPPSRPLLDAKTYRGVRDLIAAEKEASPTGQAVKGLSAQAAAIIPKVREADQALLDDPSRQEWLWECHPELSFLRLNGEQPLAGKRTPHGQATRVRLVMHAFPDALDVIADTSIPKADLTDALDAYAVLSTALLVATRQTREVLGGERDHKGLVMRMVC